MNRLSNIKILMTADTVGGVWTYAAGLACAIAAKNADVYLVTMGRPPTAEQRKMLATSVQVIESDLALEWQDPQAADFERARDFFGALQQQIRPDIVHLNSYREANFEWHAPVLVVAHSCVNSWALACQDGAWLSEPRWCRYSALLASGLDRADAWVAPTQAFGAVVCQLYRPRRRGMTIENGIELPIDGADEKTRCVLAAGRMWDTAKNITVLTAACDDLSWPTFIAGAAARTADKLHDRIELLGEISHFELRSWMRRAAIFVSPALYEPFGLSVLEAAGAGCALVLSDIPTFRELWDGAALFVAPNDISGLRLALRDLCADEKARTTLASAAFKRAQRYSLNRTANAYAHLYRSLQASPPATARHFQGECA
ncbi:MAG TPA: glycosyltransferase family 4 protein [Bradyrhizobium sp.]|uniref:glycosyltransferase family 4 protein n=1 Tax=Bradyrhizobium sp. TaxID=376 RepID=UPI002D7FB429|nr:glycosyltransferase family 4 protein [Bradyrhizobium sp.]HET7889732.1 glycosyltransferase family 4 protein [Bradyrhizobium sp.]